MEFYKWRGESASADFSYQFCEGESVSDSVTERVRALVCDQLGVAPKDLADDANILDDLGADSLDVVELVMSIEEAFEIEIADEEAESLKTLGDVERFVTSRIAA